MKELFIKIATKVIPFNGVKEMRLEETKDKLNTLKKIKGMAETKAFKKLDPHLVCIVAKKDGGALYYDIKQLYDNSSYISFELFNSLFNEIVEEYDVPGEFVMSILERMLEDER